MTTAEMTALMKVLQSFATVLGDIGLPGLIAMIFVGPAFVLALVLYMNHLATTRNEKAQAEYRKMSTELIEAYRADTHDIIQNVGTKHDNLVRLHENALTQMKSIEQYNAMMQTLIVNNTQAMEQLKIAVYRIGKD